MPGLLPVIREFQAALPDIPVAQSVPSIYDADFHELRETNRMKINRMKARTILIATILLVLVLASSALARVDRVEITARADVLNGKPFGLAGAYEKIVGRVYFKVRPGDAHNRQIVDLDKAPRNADGEVEFSADVYILRPKDAAKGNGALLLEVPNRGGKGLMRLVNGAKPSDDPTAEAEFGDGFLLRQGYTIAWLGWQFDVPEGRGMRLYTPVASGAARVISGLVRSDYCVPARRFDVPLGHLITGRIGGTGYAVADVNDPAAKLTVRDTPLGTRREIPRSEWSFAHDAAEPASTAPHLVPDGHSLHLNSGFESGKIYEVVYTAHDPVVVGLGLAALRDFVSYAKYEPKAVAPAHRAYALGISQTGRYLRHFLWQGFNADEESRQVLDGVLAHVAGAGRGSFNHRFAQPSRDAQPMSALFFPTDLFPFTDLPGTDPLSGEKAGLLDSPAADGVLPKIFYTNTSYEYWSRAGSLIHTTPDGQADAPMMDNVRVYLLAGLQHFSGPFPPAYGEGDIKGQQRQNPNPITWFWRALITDMDQWVKDGTQPPPSTYPHLADKTLVPLRSLAFPKIPNVNVPTTTNEAYHLDFGPEWKRGIITREPPVVGKAFPVFVPQVDADGNDLGGVRPPELQVPIATYTGWNLRDPSIGAPDQRTSFTGSYIPFAKTLAERQKTGDPRLSIAERYTSPEQYLGKYAEVSIELVKRRFLLPEDLPAVLDRGRQEWAEATK